jgi:hypothetical protein
MSERRVEEQRDPSFGLSLQRDVSRGFSTALAVGNALPEGSLAPLRGWRLSAFSSEVPPLTFSGFVALPSFKVLVPQNVKSGTPAERAHRGVIEAPVTRCQIGATFRIATLCLSIRLATVPLEGIWCNSRT